MQVAFGYLDKVVEAITDSCSLWRHQAPTAVTVRGFNQNGL